MSNLQHRQSKIQEKRKQTPFRDFVMEMASWFPLSFYKSPHGMSVFSETSKIQTLPLSVDVYPGAGLDYDGSSVFFQGLSRLFEDTKFPVLSHYGSVENSNYAQYVINSKNVYLSNIVIANCEDVLYSFNIKDHSSFVFNSLNVIKNCENIYSSIAVSESFNVFFSKNINNCSYILLSNNLIGCHDCIACKNLENQSYCIENKQYSKDEYMKLKEEFWRHKDRWEKTYYDMVHEEFIVNSVDSIGADIVNSSDVINGYHILNLSQGRNVMFVGSEQPNELMYDCFSNGRGDNFYGVPHGGTFSSHLYCSGFGINNSQNLFYCLWLDDCSFCLGCIGLKNKSYCILNKQYTKEEWYQKVDEIFAQMDADGTLGEFFPAMMNPFYFNDTAAYLIDPSFTKEEVVSKGYLWRDEAIKVDIPEDAQVVSSSELASYEGYDEQGNRTINADILKCVIQDEQGNYYRIIPMEYKFLMKHGLPLPRKHWLERMKENFKIN